MTKCAGCRVRHLTCDARPTCTECEKSGRECVRLNVRFRHLVCPSKETTRADYSKYEFFFDNEQKWVEVARDIEFVAGNESDADISTVDETENHAFAIGSKAQAQPTQMQQPFPMAEVESTPRTENFQFDDDPPEYSVLLEQANHDPLNDALLKHHSISSSRPLEPSDQPREKILGDPRAISSLGMTLSTPNPGWPLQNLEEARLFQHFLVHIAPWFDIGDSERHFATVAACMAGSNPLLMTAILAMAALHYNRVNGQSDMYNAMTYHDRCLGMIVPMLNDPDRASDDSVLITTTILHLYDGLESGHDLPRHLKGTSLFLPADTLTTSSGLRRAVFWLHLRQEIYNAYLYQRGVITDLSHWKFDYEDITADDDMWFHQTLYITAQVSKWAFDEGGPQSRWRELCEMVRKWESHRPFGFVPIYFRTQSPQDGRFFPEICYVKDEHVIAAHFLYLAKLLLTTHDPNLPRIGPRKKSAEAAMQETALSIVRTLVGIAACNSMVIARFTANLAVTICGGLFTDRREQEALLDFMLESSRCSGWTREKAQRALIEEWGWTDEEKRTRVPSQG